MSGRLILHMSVSMDGFLAHAERDAAHGGVRHHANLEMLAQAGSAAMGRLAYEEMAPAWSSSDSPMAQRINAMPKVIFSGSLESVDWTNARLNNGPIEQEIPRLKEESDGDIIVFGGARFAHSLTAARLVDEFRLTVHPVAVGSGKSIMHGLPEARHFELVSATVYTDGSILHVLHQG